MGGCDLRSKNEHIKLPTLLDIFLSVGYIAPSTSSAFEYDYIWPPEFLIWTHFKINSGKGQIAILCS